MRRQEFRKTLTGFTESPSSNTAWTSLYALLMQKDHEFYTRELHAHYQGSAFLSKSMDQLDTKYF